MGTLKIILIAVAVAAPPLVSYVVVPWIRNRARRLVARTKTTAIAALEDGKRARITGVVAAREALLTSPVGAHACIGYGLVISSRPAGSAAERWTPILTRRVCKPFSVTDDSGTAVAEGPFQIDLDPDDGAWANLPPQVYALLDDANVSLDDFGGKQQWSFQEALLKVGDRINVFGLPTLEVDSAGTAGVRNPPTLHHFRGTPDDPVILTDEEEPLG